MKKFITLIGIYEIVMILILSSEDVCNSILCIFSGYRHCDFCEYRGFQYLVMCLLIPAIFALIWWWKDEIKNNMTQLKQKIQDNKTQTYNKILDEELKNSDLNPRKEKFENILNDILKNLDEDSYFIQKIRVYALSSFNINSIFKENAPVDKDFVMHMLDIAMSAMINNKNESSSNVDRAKIIRTKLKNL